MAPINISSLIRLNACSNLFVAFNAVIDLRCSTLQRHVLVLSTYFSYFIVVMILGVLLARKKYPLAKYLCVLLIVTGVALFLYKDVSTLLFVKSKMLRAQILLPLSIKVDADNDLK